jgi:hypothetical protein
MKLLCGLNELLSVKYFPGSIETLLEFSSVPLMASVTHTLGLHLRLRRASLLPCCWPYPWLQSLSGYDLWLVSQRPEFVILLPSHFSL